MATARENDRSGLQSKSVFAARFSRRPKGTGTVISTTVMDVDGLQVKLVRKKMKTLRLRVQDSDGSVVVSAPQHMPEWEIRHAIQERRAWIEAAQKRVAEKPSAHAADASKEEQARWKAWVSQRVPELVKTWEPIMGVKAGKLAYRNMKSRWGSCQPATGRICINTRLALYPPECLEYVVVHELCHLLEGGHGPRFYALMDRYLPDWKQTRAKLR